MVGTNFSSNRLSAKRVRMEDFPVLVSPIRTTLAVRDCLGL